MWSYSTPASCIAIDRSNLQKTDPNWFPGPADQRGRPDRCMLGSVDHRDFLPEASIVLDDNNQCWGLFRGTGQNSTLDDTGPSPGSYSDVVGILLLFGTNRRLFIFET